jgi:hypothetical protein
VNVNTAATQTVPQAGTNIHVVGANETNSMVVVDSFGTSVGQSVFRATRARGTAAAPLPVQSGDQFANFQGLGYDGADYYTAAALQIFAQDNFSASAHGGFARMMTVPTGTTSPVEAVRFQPSGGLSIGAAAIAADPGVNNLNVAGYIQPGAIKTTGATVDFNTYTTPGIFCPYANTNANAPYAGQFYLEVITLADGSSGYLVQRATDLAYDGRIYQRLRINGGWSPWRMVSLDWLQVWNTWVPTLSVGSGALTSASASGTFIVLGKTCFFTLNITITTNGTGASYLGFTLPIASKGSGRNYISSATLVPGVMCKCTIQGSIPGNGYIAKYDNSYPGSDGATIWASGMYETA